MRDLRFALRLFLQSPAFTAVAVLTLALGIGANTAVFSIVNGALLRPLPYHDPGGLVAIWDRGIHESNLSKVFDSYHDFAEWKQHAHGFEELAAATWAAGLSRTMTGHGAARQVLALPVSDSLFRLLGVNPAQGRTFLPEDLRSGCSVVLSHQFWTGTFGADPHAAGQNVTLNHQACAILGVMPGGFAFYPPAADLWILLTPDFTPPRDTLLVGVFGRLRRGVTAAQAQTELTALHDALHRADGQERDIAPVVYDLQQEFTWLAGRNLRTTLWVLLGAVGLVLLIACFTVANLLLGRSLVRGRELAVRAAVGCSRARMIRQLLTEGLVLSAMGGALGVLVAFASLRYFRSVNPVELPVGADIGISLPALLFTAAVAIFTALLCGLAPGWKASRVDLHEALKSGGRASVGAGGQRLAKTLVAAGMALSLVLLAGAGLLLESVVRMGSAPLGFDPRRLYASGVTLPEERYPDPGRRAAFYDALEARLAAIPGVQDAALATALPPYDGGNSALQIFGRPVPPGATRHDVTQKTVSPDYFRTLGVALRRGRLFDSHDRGDSDPVALIDESLAREYFPHSDPIGQRIRVEDTRHPQSEAAPTPQRSWAAIVGVVAGQKRTIVYQEMGWIDAPSIFRALAQDPPRSVSVAVRTQADAVSIGGAIRLEIAALDGELAVNELESVGQRMDRLLAYPRFRATLLGGFATFALLLAAIGLDGVLGQLVAQRTQEIAVRVALGASPRHVVKSVAIHGGVPVLAGLAVGVIAATALGRLLTAFLYEVSPRDLRTLVAVSATLLLAAALAIALPARRAARTDPMQALRT